MPTCQFYPFHDVISSGGHVDVTPSNTVLEFQWILLFKQDCVHHSDCKAERQLRSEAEVVATMTGAVVEAMVAEEIMVAEITEVETTAETTTTMGKAETTEGMTAVGELARKTSRDAKVCS